MKGTKATLNGEIYKNTVFVHPLPFNLIPHIDKFQVRASASAISKRIYELNSHHSKYCCLNMQPNGYTKEEMKVAWETVKIFGLTDADMKVSCTAVRIPTIRAHSEAITIETEKEISADAARLVTAA